MDNELIAARIAEHENRLKVSEHRIKDLEDKTDRIENLTLSVQKLATSVESMAKEQADYRDKQNQIADKILELEKAPAEAKAKKLDEVLSWSVKCFISALIGFLLAYIGLN